MLRLSQVAESIAATTRKSEKIRLLADYFRSRTVEESSVSAIFLSGRPFPAWEETTLQVGGRLLSSVLAGVSGRSEAALGLAYRKYGDLGAAAWELLQHRKNLASLGILEVCKAFRAIAAARGPAFKAGLLRDLFARATPLEAKYLVKIMTGDLRIGLKESLVEEAIASAYGDPVRDVQRANMLLGDIGETLRLAAERRLSAARMRLFHPIGFMLASPVESARDAFDFFSNAQIEDKYDGIRAQAHVSAGEVRIFSRTLDEISESFPELLEPLAAFPENVIFDGEILAWDFDAGREEDSVGRALPFSVLQKRLGRKRPTAKVMREVPVAYVVFDVLYAIDALVIDQSLAERGALLDSLFQKARSNPAGSNLRRRNLPVEDLQGKLQLEPVIVGESSSVADLPRKGSSLVLRAPVLGADSPEHLTELFEMAQARGNEGLMIKDVASPYTPGRRGKSWLKLKRELATLDVVVTAVEFGNGKRAAVLSDYTFAVRAPDLSSDESLPRTSTGEPLLNIGKAYTGLTDAEIAKMTEWFRQHTISDNGWSRQVEPKIVLEVAFNAVMRSDRHNSGFALRFPRITRLRTDKSPEEADTIERVREIYERQHAFFKIPGVA